MESLEDLVFPPRCPFCDEVVVPEGIRICRTCMGKVPVINEPFCLVCGKPLEEETELCEDCKRMPRHFRKGYVLFPYQGAVKESLYRLKYKNRREYAVAYGRLLARAYRTQWKQIGIDGIVPVPIHPDKWKQRRYNQAELVAKVLGEECVLPVTSDYFLRVKNTAPQKELNDKERYHNLEKAFAIGKTGTVYKKILLVDDIYTTGATIESLAKIARCAGSEEVYYTAVAIGGGY